MIGTLIGNWREERILKEATGFGRLRPMEYVPKNRTNLYKNLTQKGMSSSVVFENLPNENNRVLGERYDEWYRPTNKELVFSFFFCFNNNEKKMSYF